MNFGWNYVTGQREYSRGVVTIYEYERGLLYKNGRLARVLEAGRYRVWPFSHQRIVVVDVRRATAQVSNQKLLTADQITVTLNIVADYEIADVALSAHRVANHQSQLYEDVQLAARNIVGAVTVDVLLEKRTEINAQILEAVVPLAADYGLNVLTVGIKDVILAPKVRDLLMKEAEAKRVAQAMLIGAREEVATLRALANAARLAAEHPQLLRLRELDTVRSFAGTPGNTVVMGVEGSIPLKRSATTSAKPIADDAGDVTIEE
jgi:regulator of protease activity HflC (stomatin/prohibitin superfamily)